MSCDGFDAKTIIAINHTEVFNAPSGDEITLDVGSKSCSLKTVYHKSIWSNVVEGVIQYCRIVFDLFSSDKSYAGVVNYISKRIRKFGEQRKSHYSQLINECVERLNNLVDARFCGVRYSLDSEGVNHVTVSESEWFFIDVLPKSEYCKSDEHSSHPIEIKDTKHNNSPHRFFYYMVQGTCQEICQSMMLLSELHYGLCSTIVQDIPMKEETNSTSNSTMYGVELLHQAKVHDLLNLSGLANLLYVKENANAESFLKPPSGFSKTLGIKWVTPKSSESDLLKFSSAAYRVTLADVCNRASTCLAQFVLSGRSVTLAHRLPPKENTLFESPKIASFNDEALLLTCHGSVMYLHVLANIFPLVDYPLAPLKSEYKFIQNNFRIQAFIEQILRPSRLAPASARLKYTIFPKERAKQHLERQTRYWPLLESQTLLGKNKIALVLFEHLPKEYLEANEISACEDAISKIFNSIKQHMSSVDPRKATKRGSSALFQIAADAVSLSTELDYFLSVYCDISAEHEQIRNFWIQILNTATKTDKSHETIVHSSVEDKFTSLGMKEIIRLSRTIACCQDHLLDQSIPQALVPTMRNLILLCNRLRVSNSNNSSSDGMNRTHKKNNQSENSVTIEPVNLSTFIDMLLQSSNKRQKTDRPDFSGVATADCRGQCQLYRNLKEKNSVCN